MHVTLHYLIVVFFIFSTTNSSLLDYFSNNENKETQAPTTESLYKHSRFQVESNHGQEEKTKDIYEKAMMLIQKSKKYDIAKEPNAFNKKKKSKKYSNKTGTIRKKKKIMGINYKTLASKEPIIRSVARIGKENNEMTETKNIGYALDPVLNSMYRKDFRKKADSDDDDSESSGSSSLELGDWKDQWKEHWLKKKVEAALSPDVVADDVNMVAARPWGVPCGDPNQHDTPWGSCLLPMECEAEYRIYRGDYACGRSQFVCCALQLTNYDLYQGFDLSFENSGLSTDSEEKKDKNKTKKQKKDKEKKRRKKERDKRKKKIKKNIKKIVKEIQKILNKAYKNGTQQRKKKTKQLKKFIKDLKKKFKKNRQSMKEIHELELYKIDEALQMKLDHIKSVNRQFMENATFRDIVTRGVLDKTGARMLVEAYPDLAANLASFTRRAGLPVDHPDYDVEYGMLYY